MLAAFLLTFREVLEAVLVVGIIITFLARTNRASLIRRAWLGVVIAILAAIIVAYSVKITFGELSVTGQRLSEGFLMLLAGGLITIMIFWMLRQEKLSKRVEQKVQKHTSTKLGFGIALVTFFAVFREGAELTIFLLAAKSLTRENLIQGFLAGIIGAISVGYLFFTGISKAPIRIFFQITNILLLFFAAGIITHGVGEIQQVGWLQFGLTEAYNVRLLFSDSELPGSILHTLFGYNDSPTMLELAVYSAYLLSVGWWVSGHRTQNL